MRVATGKGISNVRLMLIDDLPSSVDNANNHTPAAAQLVSPGSAVDGVCEVEASDFYKFTATAGQRISAEVVARRLGSVLDPILRVLDAQGRELAYSDDEPGVSSDSRLSYTCPAAGDYFLEVRDVRYLGGGDYRYRLRIGEFPLVTAAFPLAAAKSHETLVQPVVAAGPNAASILIKSSDQPLGDWLHLTAGSGQTPAAGSSWLTLLSVSTPDQLEREPNNSADSSTPVTLLSGFAGRLETAKDRDYFQFEAKAGQRTRFVGQTRRFGSSADLFLRLYKPDGGLLAEADDSASDEGIVDATFPADGSYRLMVEDVNRLGGPTFVYRIANEPYRPGFALAIENDKYDAPAAGTFTAKVTCTRRDYNGPIAIAVEGAGNGWLLENNVIPEGKPETVVSVTLPPALQPGTPAAVRIVGRAKIADQEISSVASSLASLRKALGGLPYPPAELEEQVGVGVGPVFPEFFELAMEPAAVTWSDVSKPISVKVKATRSSGFDEKIDLVIEGLPADVTSKPVTIAKGQAEATLELVSGAQTLPAGPFKLSVRGTANFQNQRKSRSAEVLLTVAPAQ
jgi:hypothetical protein